MKKNLLTTLMALIVFSLSQCASATSVCILDGVIYGGSKNLEVCDGVNMSAGLEGAEGLTKELQSLISKGYTISSTVINVNNNSITYTLVQK